jgi:dTDP-4-dehydrorhamnose 3,5-epimerase
MKAQATQIPGVLIVEPAIFGDDRGFFLESYNEREMRNIGIDAHFVQDNHSRSQRNVLRGLHYHVAVDVRRDSPAFGKWVGVELSAENKRMFWLPAGMAHGFVVLSDSADFLYKATEYYAPKFERTILWNDTELGIEWPLTGQPILSAKDAAAKTFRDAEVFEKDFLLKGAHAEY